LGQKVVETRGLLEGYSQVPVDDVLAKRRKIIRGTDEKGLKWMWNEVFYS